MKAIKKYFNGQFEVHCFGINDIDVQNPKSGFDFKKYFYHKIDLSIINFNLISLLEKIPKPDIILASPPCES
jgi:hypothetical protein